MTAGLGLVGTARIPPPRNVLLSYYYYRRIDIDRLSYPRIIADSGAFTFKQQGKPINQNQLCAWTKKWEHNLCWVACLDVEDQQQTRTNWLRMVNDHQLPAVSTLHAGDDFQDDMDWYASQGVDFLGIGGVAGKSNSPAIVFKWIVSVFKYAEENHPNMRFHGWGMTGKEFLRLPFWSVDSSGWGSAYRYGRVMLRHPVTGKNVGVDLSRASSGKGAFAPEVASMLVENYGVTPSEIVKAGPHNREILVKLSALSASVQEEQWRRQFRNNPITPPTWGRLKGWKFGDDNNGPHMHLVDGYLPHMQAVNDLIKEQDV
jgi:hypothetical protein